MSIFSDLENSLVTALRAWEGLAAVKTMEAEVKESLFLGDKLSQGFQSTDLPAINVSMTLSAARSRPFTTDQTANEIPASIVVVCRSMAATEAKEQAQRLADQVRKALWPLRKSGNALGVNTFVTGDVTQAPCSVMHEKPYVFAWVTVDCTILKITGDE